MEIRTEFKCLSIGHNYGISHCAHFYAVNAKYTKVVHMYFPTIRLGQNDTYVKWGGGNTCAEEGSLGPLHVHVVVEQ